MSSGMRLTVSVLIIINLPYCIAFEKNFSAYWNVFTNHCNRTIGPVLNSFGIIQNEEHAFRGEKIAIFYEFTHGLYPYFNKSSMSHPIHGGTPQNTSFVNITMHLNVSRINISEYIKNWDSSGLGIIDFEEWRPLFEQNSVPKKEVYKQAARLLTKENYPNISDADLNKTAALEYNVTARKFLEESLKDARDFRNKTLWGLYGFPYCNYNAGKSGENDTRCSKQYQDYNDRMMYIYNASQALYPSIYLGPNDTATPDRSFRYVGAVLTEAQRISNKYHPPRPIYAYTKFEYEPRTELCNFYTARDLCTTIVLPFVMGINGLIFWSSSNNMKYRCKIVTDFVNNTLGPLYRDIVNGLYGNSSNYNETTEWNITEVCSPERIENITSYLNASKINVTGPKCNLTVAKQSEQPKIKSNVTILKKTN